MSWSATLSFRTRNVRVDVRVISASTKDLRQEITAGRFREDLFYRLNVVPIRIPPLTERREDIPALISLFLKRLCTQRGRRMPGISDDALAALQAYEWPGNVRQLRNMIERTLILASSDDIAEIDRRPVPLGDLDQVVRAHVGPGRGYRVEVFDHLVAHRTASLRFVIC